MGTELLAALEKLVYLKDMKDRLEKLHDMGCGTDYDYYHKHKPLAWAEARRLVERAKTPQGHVESAPQRSNEELQARIEALERALAGEATERYECPIHGLQDGPDCARC